MNSGDEDLFSGFTDGGTRGEIQNVENCRSSLQVESREVGWVVLSSLGVRRGDPPSQGRVDGCPRDCRTPVGEGRGVFVVVPGHFRVESLNHLGSCVSPTSVQDRTFVSLGVVVGHTVGDSGEDKGVTRDRSGGTSGRGVFPKPNFFVDVCVSSLLGVDRVGG